MTFTQIATTGANLTAYDDTTVVPGTQYYYRVRATNTAGNSGYSNTALAVIPMGADTAGGAGRAYRNRAWLVADQAYLGGSFE